MEEFVLAVPMELSGANKLNNAFLFVDKTQPTIEELANVYATLDLDQEAEYVKFVHQTTSLVKDTALLAQSTQ